MMWWETSGQIKPMMFLLWLSHHQFTLLTLSTRRFPWSHCLDELLCSFHSIIIIFYLSSLLFSISVRSTIVQTVTFCRNARFVSCSPRMKGFLDFDWGAQTHNQVCSITIGCKVQKEAEDGCCTPTCINSVKYLKEWVVLGMDCTSFACNHCLLCFKIWFTKISHS